MLHPPGALGGLRPEAPEHVAAHRSLDGAAGILGDQQAPHPVLVGPRGVGGIEPDGDAEGHEGAVDREAAARGQGHALGADGARALELAEEDI